MTNKGQNNILAPLIAFFGAGMILVVILIAFSFTAKVNSDIGNSFTAGSVESGIVDNGSVVLTTLASNTNTLALVVVAFVVISILLGLLAFFRLR